MVSSFGVQCVSVVFSDRSPLPFRTKLKPRQSDFYPMVHYPNDRICIFKFLFNVKWFIYLHVGLKYYSV